MPNANKGGMRERSRNGSCAARYEMPNSVIEIPASIEGNGSQYKLLGAGSVFGSSK